MVGKSFTWALMPALAAAAALQCRNGPSFDLNDLSLRTVGGRNTLDWRVWLEKDGHPISFWHDVPLYPNETDKQIVNFVVEIPRWTDGKIEINRKEPLNPIFHDDRKGQPRFVESVFPLKTYPFVYGSIPQTWESPNFNHTFTNEPGDNDPVDLYDIGQDVGYTGQIKQVKILGAIAPNDGGETDWKVLGIDVNDPIAKHVNNFADVEKYRPGVIQSYFDWFTYYKVARGDAVIPIVSNAYVNSTFATSVIEESHHNWLELVKGKVDSNHINYNQTSRPEIKKSYVPKEKTTKRFNLPHKSNEKPAAPKPKRYDQWFYLDKDFKLIVENVVE